MAQRDRRSTGKDQAHAKPDEIDENLSAQNVGGRGVRGGERASVGRAPTDSERSENEPGEAGSGNASTEPERTRADEAADLAVRQPTQLSDRSGKGGVAGPRGGADKKRRSK